MRIPHVHKLQLDPSEIRSEETINVNIRPQEYVDDIGLFEDKKEYAKWILRMKRNIHHSFEYEELMYFLKHKRKMGMCGIHPNRTVADGHPIEIHHTPFTISDIITIVTKKRMDRKETLKMTDIAHEIMELHYLGIIGLYPLCDLCHALAHADDDELFIPLENVFGDPTQFVNIYESYLTDIMMTKWKNILTLNKGYSLISRQLPLSVRQKYIYITADDGQYTNQISRNKLIGFINELSG